MYCRRTQGASLKPDESEGCSPVSGGRTIRLCSCIGGNLISVTCEPLTIRPFCTRGALFWLIPCGDGEILFGQRIKTVVDHTLVMSS